MKIERWLSPRTCVTVEGETHMAIFEQLIAAQEVFGEKVCGKCGKDNLEYAIRKAAQGKKEHPYPEMRCLDCKAKLKYGQSDGTFFPIRFKRDGKEYVKDENGRNIPLGANGWVKYNKETGEEE